MNEPSYSPAASSAAGRNRKGMVWALGLTSTYMMAEVIGGLVTGSLALLADAAHMLTDAGGLAFALLAIRLGDQPPTPRRTFGLLRAEILTALGNAVVLLVMTVYILFEAYRRFVDPPEVMGWPMLAVAVVGLLVNLTSMRLLSAGSLDSLNVKGAYFEVLSDMLGSLGVIIAALVVTFTGWRLADPIIGACIGLFIIPRTWSLLKDATEVLLEATPARVDAIAVREALLGIPGVVDVHHLHVWTITSGLDAMSVHLVMSENGRQSEILTTARGIASSSFGLGHTTIEVETKDLAATEGALPV